MFVKKQKLIDIFAGKENEVMEKVDKIVEGLYTEYHIQVILDYINEKKEGDT